ncbi:XyeB family radical SAM/SPASM peptide maturase [Agarivorans albus]
MTWNPSRPHSIECLQIVYKIAERCNLDCTYCYYYNMGDNSALQRPAIAALKNTELLAKWIAQGCQELDIPKVLFSFHGGEPMLNKPSHFAKTCDMLYRHISPVAELNFSIQTNGTLLSDGWIEALKAYRVAVGVSIDGRQIDNDLYRLDRHGRSSFVATESSIKRLVDEGKTHPYLLPGTISVLNHQIDYREAYLYLRGLGIRSMHFLLPDRNRDTGIDQSEAIDIGNGLLAIFFEWMKEDDKDISVRFITETLTHFELTHSPGPIRKKRKSNQVLVARSDATVAIDDSYIPALDWYKTAPDFSINDFSLVEVFSDPIFSYLEKETSSLPLRCESCNWAKMCRGGDLENRYSKRTGFDNPSIYCDTYKTLYQGVCNLLSMSGYPQHEIEARVGKYYGT